MAQPDGIIFGRFSPEPAYEGSTLEEIAAEDLARLNRDMASDDADIVPGAASQAAKEGRRLP